jgi:hypothetical protein
LKIRKIRFTFGSAPAYDSEVRAVGPDLCRWAEAHRSLLALLRKAIPGIPASRSGIALKLLKKVYFVIGEPSVLPTIRLEDDISRHDGVNQPE